MKKLIQFSLLAMCCIILMGCPYESQVPISSPSIPVDNRLFGKWVCDDEVYNSYFVTKASETEYNILQQNVGQTTRFKGYLSEVKGHMFMNLYSDSIGKYYLYRVKLEPSGSKLTLLPLSHNLPDHFGSMDALKSYVEKNVNFQSLYSEADKAQYQKSDEGVLSIN